MATPINDREERIPLNTAPLEERILAVVRRSRRDDEGVGGGGGRRTVRPAILASELGLSIEEATRELCGLLSAVGGGEDGASFAFERVGMPASAAAAGGGGAGHDDQCASSSSAAAAANADGATTTTMAFTFPADFEERATRHRRRSDFRRRLRAVMTVVVKAIKVFTAFGLVVSLAVLIIAGICILVAAVVAMARGGGGGGGGEGGGIGRGGNHHLMRKLRYLFFQLRQVLWLYAICGSAVDHGNGRQDPFLREVAGDLAMMMSVCTNPYHPFFWLRLGGMRRRWERTRISRGWGGGGGGVDVDANARMDGIAMMRRGTWGENDDDDDGTRRENRHSGSWSSFDRIGDQQQQQQQQQRGLLSIAVEFLFGPGETTTPSSIDGGNPLSSTELDKWKFRAAVIISLSSKSPGSGVSLRDLLPYVDDPPANASDPSAIRETLRMVAYFNGKPAPHRISAGGDGGDDEADRRSGMDARFCFPELVSEFDCQALLSLGSSKYSPPASFDNVDAGNFSSILYKEEEEFNFGGSSIDASNDTPGYLHEKPFVLTELTQHQFGQCALLGLLNFVGIVWVQSAMSPGGLLELPATTSRSPASVGSLIAIASFLLLKLLKVLRFYAGFFLTLPLCRLVTVLIRNNTCRKRNERRRKFVMSEL